MAAPSSSLDVAQLEALDRDGYVVVPDAITAPTLARLRLAFEDAPAQDHGTQHVTVSDAMREHDTWRALAEHPAAVSAAEHVLARPFRVRELHGRNPLPGHGQQGLHADWMPRSAGEPFYVVTVIAMFDAFTVDNGATRIVPGSHRHVGTMPKALAQPLAHHPREHVVTGAAGTLLVMNGHLWHSGRRNATDGPRRAAQLVLVDAATPGAGADAGMGVP